MSRNHPKTRCSYRAAFILMALALAAGCGSNGHEEVAQAASAEAPAAGGAVEREAGSHQTGGHDTGDAAIEAATPPQALDFSATTVEGKKFESSSVAGKSTVFWFWAPGCMDCAREAPHLLAAEKAFHDDVTFVGVAGLGDLAGMKSWIKRMKIDGFTQLADTDGAIWKRFGVVAQPAYAFVDADGEVKVVKGALGAKGVRSKMAALMAK